MREWLKFFGLRLPLALVAIGMLVEGAAFLLSGVTLHRHNVDDLANAVTHDMRPYRVVLLGDSITHTVSHRFRIGEPGEVADLSTHALAGLPSSLFLLKRYLESGHRPQHVVVAASALVFVEPMDASMFNYYVTSVFRSPYERTFLEKYYGRYVNYNWRPAALSITTKLGEPLFSLVRHPGNEIVAPMNAPSSAPILESYAENSYDGAIARERVNGPAVIRPEIRAIVSEMLNLSGHYGFSLHFIWAPVQISIRKQMELNGKLSSLNTQLAQIIQESHENASIDDADAKQEYPYFDRDLVHIKGLGWEQTYANQLTSYIHQFESATAPDPGNGQSAAVAPGAVKGR